MSEKSISQRAMETIHHPDQMDLEDIRAKRLKRSQPRLDGKGREILDPVPIAPPVGYVKQPSLAEQMRAMIRSENLRAHAEQQGFETFEEADDFDVGEDVDVVMQSPYEFEEHFDPELHSEDAPPSSSGPKSAARGKSDEGKGDGATPSPDATPEASQAKETPIS